MKKTLPVLVGIVALVMITACPTPNDPPDSVLSDEKELTTFSFTTTDNAVLSSDVTGTISGTDIDLTVPFGTDVTALVATFTTTGESVTVGGTTQTSGTTANNFSSPMTYRVTAEDGSTQDYKVTVGVPAEESAGFGNAATPGDTAVLTLFHSFETITMVYAQDQASISFPTGTDDTDSATITTQFWMAETQFTNAQAVAVLQWAYDNDRVVETGGAHNEVNANKVKYGDQRLIDFSGTHNRLNYSRESFSVDSGYDDHPLVRVTWYGSVMLSNWLTEMRDGHDGNLVYNGITENWTHTDTTEDTSQNGYRLPSADEWEYAARYLGTTDPSTDGDLDTERKYGNDNTGWTNGYYWTPGNYASGATADYKNSEACQAVAVYGRDWWDGIETTEVVKSRVPNQLGMYDMSGNVWEWCFTENDSARIRRSGGWNTTDTLVLQVGIWYDRYPYIGDSNLGFRLCRTAD